MHFCTVFLAHAEAVLQTKREFAFPHVVCVCASVCVRESGCAWVHVGVTDTRCVFARARAPLRVRGCVRVHVVYFTWLSLGYHLVTVNY